MNTEYGEFMKAWYGLQEQVCIDLRKCTFLHQEDNMINHVAQILEIPSFEDLHSWDVFKTKRFPGEHFVLYHTVWHRTADEKIFQGIPFEPSISITNCELDTHKYRQRIKYLAKAKFTPFIQSDKEYLDGTSYQLAIGEGNEKCRIQWHCEMPKEWGPLKKGFEKLYSFFKKTAKSGVTLDSKITEIREE